MNGRPWTPEEDALLQKACARRRRANVEALAAELGRTHASVQGRLARLKLQRAGRPWTRAEDTILRAKWHEVATRVLRQHLPCRSTHAILQRAYRLGLSCSDRAQGLLSLSVAAERAGYARPTLLRMLERHEVVLHRPGYQGRGAHLFVAWDDVERVVAAEVQLESIRAASRRLGVPLLKLVHRLDEAGIKRRPRSPCRLPPETYDQLVRAA
jgi:hypothetical protein